ncbi:MAG: hypothetical protein VXW65_01160 [Pseudomonadota bacterium]|nr:hypothetical protein [Pseudomonadota bacterium]
MTTQTMIAIPLTDTLYQRIQTLCTGLHQAKPSLSQEAGHLMSEVACQIVDEVFLTLVQRFQQASDSPTYQDSIKTIEEVKAVMRKYLSWAIGLFSNERLSPVADYYQSIIHPAVVRGRAAPYLVFALPANVAQAAHQSLEDLQQRRVPNAVAAIEGLIQVIDVGIDQLLKEPKRLLKFNLVVDKTLNGVINMTTSMSYKSLRKLGAHLEQPLFDPLVEHLQAFLVQQSDLKAI